MTMERIMKNATNGVDQNMEKKATYDDNMRQDRKHIKRCWIRVEAWGS